MERVRIEAVENSVQPAAVMRHLTGPLGLTDIAINYYELEPGDSSSFAYHCHEIQEEVFYVQEGTATFETEAGSVDVSAGEVVRFGREAFQRGRNRGDADVVALALGAPLEYGRQEKRRHCPDCEAGTDNELSRRETADGTVVVARCGECGSETGRRVRGSMPGTVP